MGATIVQLYGAKMFMTNNIIARIVACAALGKLTTLEQLDKETGWDVDWAGQHKTELLNLIHKFFPTKSPPPTLSTTTTQPTASSEVPLPSKPKELHCRRCGGTGHISKWCLAYFPSYSQFSGRNEPQVPFVSTGAVHKPCNRR